MKESKGPEAGAGGGGAQGRACMANTSKALTVADYLVPMVGLGSYWAWMNLSASNAVVFPWLAESIYPLPLIVSSCAYLLAMAVLFVLGGRAKGPYITGVVAPVGCAAALAGSLVVAVGGAVFPEVVLVGHVIVAVGTAAMLVLWGDLLSRHGPSASGVMVAGSFVAGCSIYLFLTLTTLSDFLLVALPILLAVCGGLLLFARRSQISDAGAIGCGRVPTKVAVMFGCLIVCVFLNEVIRIISTPLIAEEFTLVGILTQIGGLAAAGVALLALALSKKKFSFNTMSRFLLPLMVAGFLSFLVFDREDAFLMFAMLGAGYWCLQLLICVALCDAIKRLRLPAVRSFALLYGLMQIAILAAKPLGSALSELLRAASSSLSLIVSLAVLIVVVLAMFLLRDGGAGSVHSNHGGAEPNRLSSAWLGEIAREYGLSPRETEVFQLLARGRSLPVIMEELTIAKGTAQTHVRHVYEKMSVHTKQELIDLIEARSGDQAR